MSLLKPPLVEVGSLRATSHQIEGDIMRNIFKITIGILLLTIILQRSLVFATEVQSTTEEEELRGLWVATVVNIDYPLQPTTDVNILKNEAITILDHAEYMGLNAVFLQVRPTADALYKSKYFPWSKHLTGSQDLILDDTFDPLEFWIDEAHERGIQLHAWINPYRITKKTGSEPKHDVDSLSPFHPARLNPNWVVKYSDGNLYFDPGIPEVRKLVIHGALEIIEGYDIDGIHFDDYFYPGKDFNDNNSYEKYGRNYSSIHDWRRENVNLLIGELSRAIKDTSKDVSFGISPFGIWANKTTNHLGSDTNGMESYYDQYADTRKWVIEGTIDYIAPQIYWNIGFEIADYSKLLSWWAETAKGTGVDLYIGQASYRAGNSNPTSPWYGYSEIERQLELNSKFPAVKGSIFFNYNSLGNNIDLSNVIKTIYEERDGISMDSLLSISRPKENIKTRYDYYYINGASDPNKPLLLNDNPVENRSRQGFFGMLIPLVAGDNIVTVSQGSSYETRIINRSVASTSPEIISSPDIPDTSTFPQNKELRTSGEKITLSCKAPIGSKVTVEIDRKTFQMNPSSEKEKDSELYLDTFTYVYTIPEYRGTPKNINLGFPTYRMNYNGTVKTIKAPAEIGVIMKNSPYYAEMINDVVYTYQTPTTVNGGIFELYEGMQDYVTGMAGNFVRLSNEQWVNKGHVKIFTSKSQLRAEIKNAEYVTGEKWDKLKIKISESIVSTVSFDGEALELLISAKSSKKLPNLPKDSIVDSIDYAIKDEKVLYTLKIKENQKIHGYYIEKTSEGIVLNIKRPIKISSGKNSLEGITIMLDPGHGGDASGALGPLGLIHGEKTINLSLGIKLQKELENLGATVLMTRVEDIDLSLEERLAASRTMRPDMFVSLHANSMGDNVDISKVDGFSVFYRDEQSKPLAEVIHNNTIETLNRKSKGVHNSNFYVTRGTWTPSVLIEGGFVPNPTEFEWLINDFHQRKLARSISQGIVKYFSQ